MLKSISFKKLAVLSAGIAIVLSSCGLQNTASESSGSGRTKNYALSNSYCYDSLAQWSEANNSLLAEWSSKGLSYSGPEYYSFMSPTQPHFKPDGTYDLSFDFTEFFAGWYDGVPCPVGTTFAESSDVAIVPLQSNGVPKDCYPQDYIDATIAGFEQPRDKADATDAYKAEMQKGIDTLKATCVKS
jgi:hypothetical protein